MGSLKFTVGSAHRVRPSAGPMAGSGRTWWLNPSYAGSSAKRALTRTFTASGANVRANACS